MWLLFVKKRVALKARCGYFIVKLALRGDISHPKRSILENLCLGKGIDKGNLLVPPEAN